MVGDGLAGSRSNNVMSRVFVEGNGVCQAVRAADDIARVVDKFPAVGRGMRSPWCAADQGEPQNRFGAAHSLRNTLLSHAHLPRRRTEGSCIGDSDQYFQGPKIGDLSERHGPILGYL